MCSIVCVPAIGADPKKTWARQIDSAGFERDRLDYALHDRLYPDAQVHLYDHLTWEERELEVTLPQGPNDQTHKKSAKAFAEAELRLSEYGVMEWAERFLQILQEYRQAQTIEQRPILFICHSTGGAVVKQALSRYPIEGQTDIVAVSLGVTFFATPHHGSSVLSKPEYVQTIQDHLGLKWKMSKRLRHDFLLRNLELEALNHEFAARVVGTKIYSYTESHNTNLRVLSINNSGVESLNTNRLCIVDCHSGKLSTSEMPIEDEDVIQLRTTHIDTPRFQGEDELYSYYVNEITTLVKGFSAEVLKERAAYRALNNDVMTKTELDVHHFYGVDSGCGTKSMKIMSAHPCLRTFLEIGPSRCMDETLGRIDTEETFQPNGSRLGRDIRSTSELAVPSVTITSVENDETLNNPLRAESTPSLVTPTVSLPENIHTRNIRTRLPSTSMNVKDPGLSGNLMSKPIRTVQFREDASHKDKANMRNVDVIRQSQGNNLFPLPSHSSRRFRWIHIPFTHAGWVPHILTTVSLEKEDLSLDLKLLTKGIRVSQHNRSHHASLSAQFIRPSVEYHMPENAKQSHIDRTTTPQSATDDIQQVLYLPYLHWDSFKNLQKRAAIIKRRRQQAHTCPIPADIALGSSVEHKLIWQHLASNQSIHYRRTLDQFGDPSLRDISCRAEDQILYKRTRTDANASPPKEDEVKQKRRFLGREPSATGADTNSRSKGVTVDEDAKVLMVDQMWLWVIDNQTVITFFTPKEKEENGKDVLRGGDLRNEIYQDIKGKCSSQCVDPYDFAALVVFHTIEAFLKRTIDHNLQVFRIFEEYISLLVEQQISSFEHFRHNHLFEEAEDISKDLDALLELRDIENELTTIDKLINQQESCIFDMISQYRDLNRYNKGVNGINFLFEVQQFLDDHREQLKLMLEDTVTAQRAFHDLLDLKQEEANTAKVQPTHERTEVAVDQSRSITTITVFIVIFLPLSFFASVFKMNSREWTGGNYPHLHTIFTYLASISLAIMVMALLVAFKNFLRRITQRFWRFVSMPFLAAIQCVGLRRPHTTAQAPAPALDLEKQAVVDREKAETRRLSMISKTHTKLNWEEELRMSGYG